MQGWSAWQICNYLCTCFQMYLVKDIMPLLLIGLTINLVMGVVLVALFLNVRELKKKISV